MTVPIAPGSSPLAPGLRLSHRLHWENLIILFITELSHLNIIHTVMSLFFFFPVNFTVSFNTWDFNTV
jgi:hypothetical protein